MSLQPCGPSQRHFFRLKKASNQVSYLRLNMFPDGGIARFRAHGIVVPVFPSEVNSIFDLAYFSSSAVAVACSDQHFGSINNLLLPGRGVDMGDGWETKRSRSKDHTDWTIVKLGTKGRIEEIIVDTAFYRGNFPEAVKIEAVSSLQVGSRQVKAR